MTVIGKDFFDQEALNKVAINLFYGWGYNFYRLESQLVADDQRIRANVCAVLLQARLAISRAELDYRQKFILSPMPDPLFVAAARQIALVSKDIGALEGQIRALPVPANDRMAQRYRSEQEVLEKLLAIDRRLAGEAVYLRRYVTGQNGSWIVDHKQDLEMALAVISETVRMRSKALTC